MVLEEGLDNGLSAGGRRLQSVHDLKVTKNYCKRERMSDGVNVRHSSSHLCILPGAFFFPAGSRRAGGSKGGVTVAFGVAGVLG